jgi:hypothetical protein
MPARSQSKPAKKPVLKAKPVPMSKDERAAFRREMAGKYKNTLARLAK